MTDSAASPTERTTRRREHPLTQTERGLLMLAAATTILAFYFAALASVLVLGAVVAVLAAATVIAARFGGAGIVGRLTVVPTRLIRVIGRNLWLPSAPTYRLELQPADAPRLFETLRSLAARLAVSPPNTVYVEMHAGAWVMMKGFRRGAGRSILGIGFDLLAGLTTEEVEAVLAHELAHAKRVRRGLSRWLNKGLGRLSQTTTGTSAFATSLRAQKSPSELADVAEKLFRTLTLRATRLVATYSRQDEFEADRVAASICGAATLSSALAKLERLAVAVGWLPWSERLARIQPGKRFTEWLVSELTRDTVPDVQPASAAVDHYSTHPSTHDRIAALASDGAFVSDAPRGIELLDNPDGVAERLMAAIDAVLADREEHDSKLVAREARKWARRGGASARSMISAAAIVVAGILFVSGLGAYSEVRLAWVVGLAGFGIVVNRYSSRRGRFEMPVPTYGSLTYTRRWESVEAMRADEKEIEKDLTAVKSDSQRARQQMLLKTSYDALAASDYFRAHVAARLAIHIDGKSIDAALAYAVAAAGLGNTQQTQQMLAFIKRREGFTSISAKWGAAWALSLLDAPLAEGLLLQLRQVRPNVATFSGLLAYMQNGRNKLQSAIRSAEHAVMLEPENRAIRWLLVHLLLVRGSVTDAARQLAPMKEFARTDVATALLFLRLALLERDLPAASDWAGVVRTLSTDGAELVALGHLFGGVRLESEAGTFFSAALDAGFTPEANLGLATMATFRGDRDAARRHLFAALRFDQAKLTKGETLPALFHRILAQINALEDHKLECRAWIATFPLGKMLLAERSLVVCATSESSAREHLERIVTAMTGPAAFDLARVSWREAPAEDQPVRPVQPGVKGIIA